MRSKADVRRPLWVTGSRQKCPTGKSLRIIRNRVKSRLQKYFCFPLTQISSLIRPSGLDKRGVAHVINVGPDAVDAAARETNAVCYVRRSRVVLTPRCWRQVCDKERRRRCQTSLVTGEGAK